MKKTLFNWGLYPKQVCDEFTPGSYPDAAAVVKNNPAIIARGNGKCYGDASLGSNVMSTLDLNKIISFDKATGIINCQAGILLDEILVQVVPEGFFLPVTPGTKFITIGGALASDIHGKNHHVDGVFSDHVLSFKLIDTNGDIVDVYKGDDLFNQTAGGLGRTGIILEVTFSLKRITSSFIDQKALRASNLEEIFELFEKHKSETYSVAWIDCLAKGKKLGRSVLLLGDHAAEIQVPKNKKPLAIHSDPFFNIGFMFPSWVLNPLTIKIFNFLFYAKPSSSGTSIVHYDPYFYPLDKVRNWNRIYGKKGFIQYQFVLPLENSFEGVKKTLGILSGNNLGSFLAVLKLFGKSHEDRYLHFPQEGYTLALDIKISDKIWPVLDEIDEIVNELGGKVYLTKDARLSHKSYLKQYPNRVPESPIFQSSQMIRLNNPQKNVFLILGANSDIAKATVIKYLLQFPDGHVILASRNTDVLDDFVNEKNIRGKATVVSFDAEDFASHKDFVDKLPYKPNWVMYAAGVLVNNEECLDDPAKWLQNANVNFTGAVSILNALVADNNPMLERIIGISSLAGLRGRKSNYMYGSAKSGFHQYLFGLRQELKNRGITVNAVTPGMVKTKMTAGLALPGFASSADEIASLVVAKRSRFELVPGLFWKAIAFLVKNAPEIVISRM